MGDAIEKMGHVVALAQPQLTVDAWTRERIDLVKKTVCPQGISDAEFALFIEQCKRSGLDPLLKEAFCVKRRQNVGTRDNPKWIDKFEFQPAETGFLSRAERFPDYRGIMAAAVHAGDEIEIDAGAGVVKHAFKPTAKRGPLMGAWAKVEREGKSPIVVWLELGGYQQSGGQWGKIPGNMMEKCARVSALRKAYPAAFGGLYIREELPGDVAGDVVNAASATVEPVAAQLPAATTTATLPKTAAAAKAQLEAKVAQMNAAAPANGQTVDAKPHKKMVIEDVSKKPAPSTNPHWLRVVAVAEKHGLSLETVKQEMKSRYGKTKPADVTEADADAFERLVMEPHADAEPPLPDAPPPFADEASA